MRSDNRVSGVRLATGPGCPAMSFMTDGRTLLAFVNPHCLELGSPTKMLINNCQTIRENSFENNRPYAVGLKALLNLIFLSEFGHCVVLFRGMELFRNH